MNRREISAQVAAFELTKQVDIAIDAARASSAIVAAIEAGRADFAAVAGESRLSLLDVHGIREIVASARIDASGLMAASALIQSIGITTVKAELGTMARASAEMIQGILPSIQLSGAMARGLAEAAQVGKLPNMASVFGHFDHLQAAVMRTGEMTALLTGIGDLHRHSIGTIAPLRTSLRSLTTEAASVWENFPQSGLESVSTTWLWEAPVVQPFQAAKNLVQLVGAEEQEAVDIPRPSSVTAEPISVVYRLESVGSEFARVYLAAHDALQQRGGDYIRHASVSLRELLDKLLMELAPEEAVKGWPPSAEVIANQPHKARLRYLFRNFGSGNYARFAEKDIDLILQTFYALNSGTHSLEPPFVDDVMPVLQARIDGHLLLLLTVAGL